MISVRGKDMAGNWGPVTTATLRISGHGPGLLFGDGFEMGNLAAWSASSGGVSAMPGIDMEGGMYGMETVINGSAPAYVVDMTPFDAASYEVNFYINPNGFDTGGTEVDIFTGWSSNSTALFGLQYERTAAGPEVRGWVLQAGTMAYTSWVHLADGSQTIGLRWESKDAAKFSLLLGGTSQETITDLNTSAYVLAKVWLGPSAGLTADMAGTMYFDGFASKRLDVMGTLYLPMITR